MLQSVHDKRDCACSVTENEGMTTPAGHCTGRSGQ